MLDALAILITIAFFALATSYAKACDLLKPKDPLK